MEQAKLDYCYALANDLEIRGEVASANFVRRLMRERDDLLNALDRIAGLQEEHDGEDFETVTLHAEQIARSAITKARKG